MEKGETMDKQSHYENFQSLTNDQDRISYLNLHKGSLSQYNINTDNLIKCYTTGLWPWNRPKEELPLSS